MYTPASVLAGKPAGLNQIFAIAMFASWLCLNCTAPGARSAGRLRQLEAPRRLFESGARPGAGDHGQVKARPQIAACMRSSNGHVRAPTKKKAPRVCVAWQDEPLRYWIIRMCAWLFVAVVLKCSASLADMA